MNTAHEKLAQSLKRTLDEDQLTNCMRCGFCQTACPTFIETGLEAASPRGRIALMKAVVDGLMEPDESFRSQMDLCLGCRACEPACPSDVKYGQLIEQTRAAIAAEKPYSLPVQIVRKTFLQGLFPHRGRLKLIGKAIGLYQRSGLQRIARGTGAMKLFPEHLRQLEQALPAVSGDGMEELWKKAGLPYRHETTDSGSELMVIPAAGEPVGRVGMFRGCIMDMMFAETNVNTVRLLRQAGFDIVIPKEQNCCGALHAHAGEIGDAKKLAAQNIWAFGEANVDYIASNAGGCGALLKEYDHLMHEDADDRLRQAAVLFAGQVQDISELLHNIGRSLTPAQNEGNHPEDLTVVTYQDSCHLRNVMRVQGEPRQLLSKLPGTHLCELQGAEVCCGSAGIYNLTQTEMSSTLLDHKMEHVADTGAKVVVTSNPGCLLQMKWGIERAGMQGRVEAVHLADYLADGVLIDDGTNDHS